MTEGFEKIGIRLRTFKFSEIISNLQRISGKFVTIYYSQLTERHEYAKSEIWIVGDVLIEAAKRSNADDEKRRNRLHCKILNDKQNWSRKNGAKANLGGFPLINVAIPLSGLYTALPNSAK